MGKSISGIFKIRHLVIVKNRQYHLFDIVCFFDKLLIFLSIYGILCLADILNVDDFLHNIRNNME